MNAELTPREHADMRDTILAGAQRLGSESHRRTRVIATAVAVVLVAGISGGAVAAASLIGKDVAPGPVTTSTQTAEPEPTETTAPTPTPTTPPPAGGVLAFGGECENALDEGEVEAVAGIPMMLSDYRWKTGANEVLGGIDCVWVSDGVYLEATVHLYAYPAAVTPEEVRAGTANGCVSASVDGTRVECTVGGLTEDTWLVVRAAGDQNVITEAAVAGLFDDAAGRLADYPAATPALRAADWWQLPDCHEIVASIDPAVYGFERVALLSESSAGASGEPQSDLTLYSGVTSWCELHFTSGSGDATTGEVVRMDVVPGGAIAFPTAVNAVGAEPVTVDGAQAAVIAPGLNRYEGSGSVIVVTDGVNILMVTPDFVRETSDAAPLAAAILEQVAG